MDFSFLNYTDPVLISANHVYTDISSKTIRSYGLRRVEYMELDYITWGNGTMITDGKKYPTVPGTLFIRLPGTYVEGILPYHCYYIKLDLVSNKSSFHPNESGSLIPKDFPKVVSFDNSLHVENLFSRLYAEYIAQKENSTFIIKTCLLQIFMSIYDIWNAKEKFKDMYNSVQLNHRKILSTANLMENQVERHYTLGELADMSGYSKYAFCRVFKDVIGETPINYLNRCKINNAKKLLLETNKNVKEIMLECGFSNEPHFFTLFKKLVGSSPLEFRRENKLW